MTIFKKIAVGISGGVDSAVAALFLKRKGFDVHGVFMKNWDIIDETGVCTAEKDYEDALTVCNVLRIPLAQIDFVKQYWLEVFENLVNDYQLGLTPNPDILCNRHVKFKYFYNYCIDNLKVDAIATGHYANTSFGPYLENFIENEDVKLLRPFDSSKDQTFFLSQVEQESLRKTMFPLANIKKVRVRDIAQQEGLLNVACKKDSTGICFIGKRHFQKFISEYINPNKGNFVDLDTGQTIHHHYGIHLWTIGQKARISGKSKAYYIARKNVESNTILLVDSNEHSALMSKYIFTGTPIWIRDEPKILKGNGVLKCTFQYINIQPQVMCRIMKYFEKLIIIIDEPVKAVAQGQYAVFYVEDECLGSARISYVGSSLFFLNK